MAVRNASAEWRGSIKEGSGTVKLGSGAFEGKYSFQTRFEDAPGTNPEELVGAAHAGCYSMALSGALGRAGFEPQRIATTAKVHLGKVDEGFAITRIDLTTEVQVAGIDEAKFQEVAHAAKEGCPISKALKAVEITLDAKRV
jgi:osmotically inducible protein OsmC